jgi:hypothetical protein
VEPELFDALSFPDAGRPCPSDARLRAPILVGPGDETEFVCLGRHVHLGRLRRCGWHLALHRDPDGAAWTHLYRVLHEPGDRLTVLLARAGGGDLRHEWRHETLLRARSPCLPSSGPGAGLRG